MVLRKAYQFGNYTSQCFANIYLNEMDQYAKNELKLKYWYRYMDDMIAIVKTKNEAIKQLDEIRRFLKENLRLELNSKTQIFKSTQGVNFCGYKINEHRLKIREKGKRKLKKKIKKLKYEIKNNKITTKEAYVRNLKDKLFYE